MLKKDYAKEEKWNMLTHALGLALGIVAMLYLLFLSRNHSDSRYSISAIIYGSSLVALYLSSTLYHSSRSPLLKQIFRLLDHSSIYLLIAGTYTPVMLISLRDSNWGLGLLIPVWLLAIFGIFMKVVFVHRFKLLSLIIYLGMGWLSVLAIDPMVKNIPGSGYFTLVVGGLCYSFGVVFYIWRRLPYNHAIWHLFVLAGSFFHFLTIYFIFNQMAV